MKRPDSGNGNGQLLTFGGHLEVLRRMLFRIVAVVATIAVVVFCLKDWTFGVLLAPSKWDFVTYRLLESAMKTVVPEFCFEPYHVDLIATELASQFMTHITTSVYLGLLGASPYILYELFHFVSPALYTNERRYSVRIIIVIYILFIMGLLMSYYVIFPISFRFLGTYSVDESVRSTITLDSYISSFVTLSLLLGVVFQLPVIAFLLSKLGLVTVSMLSAYRRHAILVIAVVAAIITPPDVMSQILVGLPLYLLYEVSIRIVGWTNRKDSATPAVD